MVTGIHVSDELVKEYNELKINKKYRYIILGLNDQRNGVELLEKGDRDKTLKDLESSLPKDNCRYVVFDFDFLTFENPPRESNKLILILWTPDIAPIKVKVPFTGTKAEIKGSFVGISKDILAPDFSFLDHEELRKECA
mmetsp:Transcript_25389/g.26450  ORF Transcript_25389/g.26450 Transcript_25389/m.26450 type:complete len:139 (+) Transcript_25389:37-453(+)